MTDHSTTLESLARKHNRSPLEVLELFNERAAIRQHEGNMPRGAAEEWAVEDCRAYFAMAGSGSPVERAACPADATGLDLQTCSRNDSVAIGEK